MYFYRLLPPTSLCFSRNPAPDELTIHSNPQCTELTVLIIVLSVVLAAVFYYSTTMVLNLLS